MSNEIQIVSTNRKASFQYFLLDTFKAGMVLTGTEVKSVRKGKVSMSDAYCFINKGELFVKGLHIAEYDKGGVYNHEAKRLRKLLLQKRELRRLGSKLKEKGLTVIPVEMFINERGLIKLKVALAKGKKFFSKRNSIKERDQKRDLDRSLKDYG